MRIKIDTKERFKVITILEPLLTARLAAEFMEILQKGMKLTVQRLKHLLTWL